MIDRDSFIMTFTQFKEALEPEFEIIFRSRSERYMIIKYKDNVTFQKCGIGNGGGHATMAGGLLYKERIGELGSDPNTAIRMRFGDALMKVRNGLPVNAEV